MKMVYSSRQPPKTILCEQMVFQRNRKKGAGKTKFIIMTIVAEAIYLHNFFC